MNRRKKGKAVMTEKIMTKGFDITGGARDLETEIGREVMTEVKEQTETQ